MTDLRNQRRVASQVLDCGQNRVWLDPLHSEEIAEAVTRADMRKLVKKGFVKASQVQGTSRARANRIAIQKKKGRRKGPGSRKGASGARNPRKLRWMRLIRPIRIVLKTLRDEGKLKVGSYRKYYRQAKGGVFRSKAHLLSHLKTDGAIKEE